METRVQPPPRLLIGITLLFWGAMTARPLLGLLIALLIEGANWIRFRWKFGEEACSTAWRLSMALFIIGGVLIWLDGDRFTTLPRLLVWLPVILLPLQFIQSFGLSQSVALNNFSLFKRYHRERNRQLGLGSSVIRFNFGNCYFATAIIAASLGIHARHLLFFPGLVILSGWLVHSRAGFRTAALPALLLIGSLIGIGGQIGMTHLYRWATDRPGFQSGHYGTSPTVSRTRIGSLGELKQSPAMLWRVTPDKKTGTPPPDLLRIATYNRYSGTVWKNNIPEPDPPGDDENFRVLDTIELTEGNPYHLLREEMNRSDIRKDLPSFALRGASGSERPLPLPGNTATLQDFETDGFEINPLGTVRIFPRHSIIHGTVRWNAPLTPDAPPYPGRDLEIDPYELAGIRRVAAELELKNLPGTAAKIARLRQFFTSEFEYTRYLGIRQPRPSRQGSGPIETFLTSARSGHCEILCHLRHPPPQGRRRPRPLLRWLRRQRKTPGPQRMDRSRNPRPRLDPRVEPGHPDMD